MNFNPICALFLARSNSTGHEILLKMGVNPVEFIGMIPNSTREAYKCNPSEFTPIFSNISCPVEFDRLVKFDRARNTAQIGSKSSGIHWDDTQFDQGGIQM